MSDSKKPDVKNPRKHFNTSRFSIDKSPGTGPGLIGEGGASPSTHETNIDPAAYKTGRNPNPFSDNTESLVDQIDEFERTLKLAIQQYNDDNTENAISNFIRATAQRACLLTTPEVKGRSETSDRIRSAFYTEVREDDIDSALALTAALHNGELAESRNPQKTDTKRQKPDFVTGLGLDY